MRTLNRLAIAAGIALTASAFSVSSAFAQTTTDDINLSATVDTTLDVTVDDATFVADLAIGGEGTAVTDALKVAEFTVTTNDADGLTLTAASASGGDLVGGTTAATIAYQVAAVVRDAAAPTAAADVASFTENYTTPGTTDLDFYIKLTTPAANYNAETYTDTITLTVADI